MQQQVMVIGAGKRVFIDLIPCLTSLGVEEFDIIVVRQSLEKVPYFSEILVFSDLDQALNIFKGDFIFCCIPEYSHKQVIESLKRIKTSKTIFFDTPIKKNYDELRLLNKVHDVRVLEETQFIPWLPQLKNKIRGFNIIVLWRLFYDYHGVAFLRGISDEVFVRKINLPFHKTFFYAFLRGSIVLMGGYHNKVHGKFSIVRLLPTVNLSVLNQRWQKQVAINFFKSKGHLNYSFLQNPLEDLIYDGFLFENLQAWKKIGLYLGLYDVMNSNSNLFPVLEDAIINEMNL